jgi:hypothetical protein
MKLSNLSVMRPSLCNLATERDTTRQHAITSPNDRQECHFGLRVGKSRGSVSFENGSAALSRDVSSVVCFACTTAMARDALIADDSRSALAQVLRRRLSYLCDVSESQLPYRRSSHFLSE